MGGPDGRSHLPPPPPRIGIRRFTCPDTEGNGTRKSVGQPEGLGRQRCGNKSGEMVLRPPRPAAVFEEGPRPKAVLARHLLMTAWLSG